MLKEAGQSKRHSMLEAATNVLSGMLIALTISQLAHVFEPQIQKYIWKDFVWKLTLSSNIVMTTTLTVVSVARGYVWRRYFNKIQLNGYK